MAAVNRASTGLETFYSRPSEEACASTASAEWLHDSELQATGDGTDASLHETPNLQHQPVIKSRVMPRGKICEHGRHRRYCKPCGGSAICMHGRDRRYCRDCGGSAICPHGKTRRYCRECKGSTSTAQSGPHGQDRPNGLDSRHGRTRISPYFSTPQRASALRRAHLKAQDKAQGASRAQLWPLYGRYGTDSAETLDAGLSDAESNALELD
jgi:hypothetical protein